MANPPKPLLFISDLHLEEERPDITQAFLAFLRNTASQASALYILGDFFNLWTGDDNQTELTQTIANKLTELTQQGTQVFIMHGNRDFLIGNDYVQSCGAKLIHEPHFLTYEGKNYLLMHGDSLCTRDTDYMQFRSMVRDPDWQKAFLAKPLQERIAFGEHARAQSKAMSSNKATDIMDVTQDEVDLLMLEQDVFRLIHGHTHRPARHDFSVNGEEATRIVLGDWDQHGWYLNLSSEGETLLSFDLAP